MKKKTVTVDIISLDPDDFSGPLNEIVVFLQTLQTDREEMGFSNLRIRNDSAWDSCSFMLTGTRLETNAEFNRRLKAKEKEKDKEKAKEEKERQEYERLRAKFEKE